MTRSMYSMAFNFQLEDSKIIIPLIADVEIHHSETYYVIKNIRVAAHQNWPVLPDIAIKKKNGQWVHVDSEKESRLSTLIGERIEGSELEKRS